MKHLFIDIPKGASETGNVGILELYDINQLNSIVRHKRDDEEIKGTGTFTKDEFGEYCDWVFSIVIFGLKIIGYLP